MKYFIFVPFIFLCACSLGLSGSAKLESKPLIENKIDAKDLTPSNG